MRIESVDRIALAFAAVRASYGASCGHGFDHWLRSPAGNVQIELVRGKTVVASAGVDVVPDERRTVELDAR